MAAKIVKKSNQTIFFRVKKSNQTKMIQVEISNLKLVVRRHFYLLGTNIVSTIYFST
jgi:hypothetical protein